MLEKINRLIWLKELFGSLVVTAEVADEYGNPLPNWIAVRAVSHPIYAVLLAEQLGKGEAASIALALELENPLLILDDHKARTRARSLGLTFTGTSGILLLAKKRGHCTAIQPELDALRQAGMWISPALYQHLLDMAGE